MRHEIVSELIRRGAVAVIRMSDPERLVRVVEAICEGGVTAIEITMSVPRAFQMIEEVARRLGDVALVGAGSVLDAETARLVIEAGARYVVSPVFKPEIIQTAHRYDVPALPGAFTPTEILSAHEAGADIVKVFPADVVGMGFFKAIKAPMPQLKLMPTGGVTLTNAGEWLRAGACAVGVGSALLDRAAIAEGRWEKLTENARTLMESIRQARAQ
ncbi:2-dehydro-3-deoxyphosphogluconate aldolase/4-hydroxy-2-oxoglutarate aldolase [Rhodothermus marinus SG0.5JP17-172]|uniref:bifunctional 4-hydroxy-2-oxoglutarate aldolase/2-dehydro-3-deoxy-phosphogluconate aldolase n=1 Tax=Rhodothermus marinus TaxID=29549 RepID=UPI000223DBFE|nr:bifunctional 4-hydroxy-2-oxoglutarate aldolase/2-dehydro-3-deoxy-phosphogluconate aldolase [Rhodothermus marinus]AEN74173.1 2-dehydro-3-deoxyphosphogluconate aldolase/4-hydroxy-2-oxoglutarate aldolase [Rhodothermus marinus SG0.5JP17-172]MBO2490850.1 bifunctional 4-hydroxy-2-oxoglutarate aldolase/2-dehydro-3-deoxy-phosphogluconate aldolase [Rhodothermus marinus]